jgi:hypothetical protein
MEDLGELAPVSVRVGGSACDDCPEQLDEGEFGAPAGAVDVDSVSRSKTPIVTR